MLHRAKNSLPAGATVETIPTRIAIRNLFKTFVRRTGDEVQAIDGVSLDVSKGEFVVLLGPSGCGKSTLLRCVAGLERPTDGEISIGDRLVSAPRKNVHVPPEDRRISMMFQSYAIWPHMTVAQNVGYPLQVRRRPRAEIRQAVDTMLRTVGLGGLADEYPGQLSGGQQQRVGLARCLIVGPEVVLFDEPLSNVDARVRRLLRRELVSMQREFGFAGVYVTHDQDEAMQIADRVVLMRTGRAAQVGAPGELYEAPNSRYAASFLGEINEIPGRLVDLSDDPQTGKRQATVETAAGTIVGTRVIGTPVPPDEVIVAVRPHQLHIAPRNAGVVDVKGESWLYGRIERQVSVGAHTEFIVDIRDGTSLAVWSAGPVGDLPLGTEVRVAVNSRHVMVFPATDSAQ